MVVVKRRAVTKAGRARSSAPRNERMVTYFLESAGIDPEL